MNDLYQEAILDEYKHLQNKGELSDADITLEGGNASCGDEITVYVKVDGEGGISDISWTGTGCVISQVGISLLTQKVKSEKWKVQDISKLTKKNILELLGLEQISAGREKCLMLGVNTLKKVIEKLSKLSN